MGEIVGRVVVGAGLIGGVYFAGLCLSRLPRVWRGETLGALPIESLRGPRVDHRSYPVFTMWLTCLVAGIVIMVVGAHEEVPAVAAVGVLLILVSMFVAFPLWLLVNAVNRPRFIVPPSRRDERGWIGRRSSRKRAGSHGVLMAHRVEILDVRPLPDDDKNQFEPYLVARCRTEDCDWIGDIVDASEPAGAETVRRQAAGHSPGRSALWADPGSRVALLGRSAGRRRQPTAATCCAGHVGRRPP